MRPEDYPEQEPFTRIGTLYHEQVMQRTSGIDVIEIAVGDDPYQSLLVVPAAEPRGDVLCLMHGGGWTNGYKEWMVFMAPALSARGITTVSIGYRLAPQHIYPAGLHDCMDAIGMVYREIANYGGDPERLFVGGHSAGGHLAALLSLRTDWQASRQLPADVIRGALPISGTYWFGEDSGLSMRPRFLGEELSGHDAAASPTNYLRGNAPPFLVAWGDRDFGHLITQAKQFSERLKAAGTVVETIVLSDCDHLGASYAAGEVDGTWVSAADRFMQDV